MTDPYQAMWDNVALRFRIISQNFLFFLLNLFLVQLFANLVIFRVAKLTKSLPLALSPVRHVHSAIINRIMEKHFATCAPKTEQPRPEDPPVWTIV